MYEPAELIALDAPEISNARLQRKRQFFTICLMLISGLTIFSLLTSQSKVGNTVKLYTADVENLVNNPDILSWNPTLDPVPTPSCATFNYNVILLFDRSPQYLADLGPELQALKDGTVEMLDRLSLFARNRGGHARVILGAYATYNVWQNIPEDRLTGTNWDATKEQEWRDSIDITVPANLAKLKNSFLNIYTPAPVSGANAGNMALPITQAGLGYTGGEPSRDFWASDYPNKNDPRNQGWGFDNLHDALIQSAREISRWSGGQPTLPEDSDIDLVLALTSGEMNVNNGPNLFPSKSAIATNPPVNLWNLNSGGNWWDSYSGSDDVFRTQEIVSKLRSGQALPRPYKDPNVGTPNQLKDSLPAYDGARPPTRVFGHAVISDKVNWDAINNGSGNLLRGIYGNPFLHMGQVFGSEYRDYGAYNPPTGQHRHWDKTFGDIKSNEILSDMSLSLFDAGCAPPSKAIHPAIKIEPTGNKTQIQETESGTVYATVTNTGDVDLENIEVWVNAEPVDNIVTHQIEKTCYLPILGSAYDCHEIVTEKMGTKWQNGQRANPAVIPYLAKGASIDISYEITTSLGSTSKDFPAQVWGHAFYDPTFEFPPAEAPGVNQSNGYVWANIDVGFGINPIALPS